MLAFFEEKSWTEKLRAVFWGVLILGLILIVFVLFRGQSLVIRTPDSYQAVFLDNGQVYFGRLKQLNRDYLSLTDVYYLRAGNLQQVAQAVGTGGTAQEIDLIKLGAEVHMPKDEMIINRAHVVFYEDIGQTGQIMQLIRKHQQEQKP